MTLDRSGDDAPSSVDIDRRKVLGWGLAAPAVALGASVLRSAATPRYAFASTGIPMRRSIGALAADDGYVQAFRDAVGILRQRSIDDPLSPIGWDGLALQHALYCSSVTANLQVHWGWDFLTWHRGNIWMLERILRDAIKEPQFALPYWDASTHRRIPAVYWGEGNPLFDGSRLQGPEDELPDDLLDARGPLTLESFFAFGGYPYDNPTGDLVEGALEQGFHNNVHNWVGGNMAMFATAGFETLFSAHHNNIDRAWEAWRAMRGRGADPADPVWLDRRYEFVNEKGQLEFVSVRDMLDTTKMGYVFDDFAFGGRQQPDPRLDARHAVVLPVEGRPLSGDRRPKVLRFQRADVPTHPYCCRVFLQPKGESADPANAVYVGTFTVLPVQRGGAKALDKGVTMQLSLPDHAFERFDADGEISVVLVGVPLKGRAIPDRAVFPTNATLVDRLA